MCASVGRLRLIAVLHCLAAWPGPHGHSFLLPFGSRTISTADPASDRVAAALVFGFYPRRSMSWKVVEFLVTATVAHQTIPASQTHAGGCKQSHFATHVNSICDKCGRLSLENSRCPSTVPVAASPSSAFQVLRLSSPNLRHASVPLFSHGSTG
ncbi:hypothetical protein BV20DRAFT_16960 [Pilatotrama ljubarskyi]|nr:hypothetical protein BV20DRAFT_16960 [Pilatotrama ljubarskyi]